MARVKLCPCVQKTGYWYVNSLGLGQVGQNGRTKPLRLFGAISAEQFVVGRQRFLLVLDALVVAFLEGHQTGGRAEARRAHVVQVGRDASVLGKSNDTNALETPPVLENLQGLRVYRGTVSATLEDLRQSGDKSAVVEHAANLKIENGRRVLAVLACVPSSLGGGSRSWDDSWRFFKADKLDVGGGGVKGGKAAGTFRVGARVVGLCRLVVEKG